MVPHATTIRLDPKLKKAVMQRAKKYGITFSDAATILFHSFALGEMDLSIRYSKKYLDSLERESKKTMGQYRQGKIKGYTSAKELMDDLHRDAACLSSGHGYLQRRQ